MSFHPGLKRSPASRGISGRFRGVARGAAAAALACLALSGAITSGEDRETGPASTTLPADSLTARYREASERLIAAARTSSDAYENLAVLTDEIGNRLSGSVGMSRAIDWAQDLMRREGFANVHAESVMVPVWVRGEESAEIVAPVHRRLSILGLGRSVGTPPEGVTAEVRVVSTFAELDSLGAEAGGKIILFDAPFVDYETTVAYRVHGASRAARLGAVATLVRSITPASLDTPHTGTLFYAGDAPRIPAAAVTLEDARLIHRMVARGDTVRVHLTMEAQTLPDAPSANVVGEIPGRERPEEIVLLGSHLDSWDVGQGAQDDGSGCLAVIEAAHLIGKLDLGPRRTIRVVLFVNEEDGLRGGLGYRDRHAAELERHVAAIESDLGNGPLQGYDYELLDPQGAPGGPRRGGAPRRGPRRGPGRPSRAGPAPRAPGHGEDPGRRLGRRHRAVGGGGGPGPGRPPRHDPVLRHPPHPGRHLRQDRPGASGRRGGGGGDRGLRAGRHARALATGRGAVGPR